MTLSFTDGSSFALGACRYMARRAASGNIYVRPFLSIAVEGQYIEAAIDTGGFFLILNPEIGDLLMLEPNNGEHFDNRVPGVSYKGCLHRVELTLVAERGESFDVEVTAFVPEGFGDFPNFLGWALCLERFRFAFEPDAIDPTDGWFHFGPIDAL